MNQVIEVRDRRVVRGSMSRFRGAASWAFAAEHHVRLTRARIEVAEPAAASDATRTDHRRVDVHLVVADGLVRCAPPWLALEPEDEARSARLQQDDDRRRFLTGRVLAHALTHDLLGEITSTWSLHADERRAGTAKPSWVDGAPESHGPANSTAGPSPRTGAHRQRFPSLSISHAGDVVVVALCENADVGVDVEARAAVASMDAAALAVIVGPEERAELDVQGTGRAPGNSPASGAARLFTAKEAALKAIGWGFGVDPRRMRVADGQIVAFDDERARPITLAQVVLPPSLADAYCSHVAVAW